MITRALLMFGASAFCITVLQCDTAKAVKILRDGTVVFYDDFEQDPLGTVGGTTIPIVGKWFNEAGDPSIENADPPGAYEGSQYLRLFRDGEMIVRGAFADELGDPTAVTTGQMLRAKFAVNCDTASPANIQFSSFGIEELVFLTRLDGTIDLLVNPGGFLNLEGPLTWTPDVWQVWTIEHLVGSTSLTLSIDGASHTYTDMPFTSSRVDSIRFTGLTGDGSLYYVDALIPGDVNFDGVVNIFDINLVSAHWNETGPVADANDDMIVNIFDINLISSNWSPPPSAAAAVPEPSGVAMALLAIAGTALGWRESRRRNARGSSGVA